MPPLPGSRRSPRDLGRAAASPTSLGALEALCAPALLLLLLAPGCTGEPAAVPDDPCELSTPGASWLAFASHRTGDYEIWLTRADGTCQRRLGDSPFLELHPSWSPDGVIAFTSDRAGALGVWLHDLRSGQEAQLDTGDVRASSPAYSPDGATLAFEGRAAGAADTDIYVVPAAGGAPTALASDGSDDAGPAWSPDGGTIFFVSARSGAYEIHSVPAAGGAVTQRTTGSRIIGRPVVAPAGDRLYFARTKAGSSATEVVRLVLDGGALEVVSSQGDSEPAVSPAGDRIALRSFRHGDANAELVVVDEADGGRETRLTTDPASDGTPTFAPARSGP